MKQTLIHKAHDFVKTYLRNGLTNDHTYHNYGHTISVFKTVNLLTQFEDVTPEQQEILAIAALFHDTGIVENFEGHEEKSAQIAVRFLQEQGKSEAFIQEVSRCICATVFNHEPKDLLEKIIRDADVNNLGNDAYLPSTSGLLNEMRVFFGKDYSKLEWYKLALTFANEHHYFTESANEIFGAKKLENIELLKKKINKAALKESSKDGKNTMEEKLPLMIFKTALRNHIDLSALADGKANTMLSANALIITITLPLILNTLKEDLVLGIPAIILLLTCILSMVFATSATRPIKTLGITSEEQLKKGSADLFFFGNFYNMNFDKYKEGMDYILSQENYLSETTYRNLFFSGKALGGKFNKLRICYTIFMIGIILTVVGYGVAYTISFG